MIFSLASDWVRHIHLVRLHINLPEAVKGTETSNYVCCTYMVTIWITRKFHVQLFFVVLISQIFMYHLTSQKRFQKCTQKTDAFIAAEADDALRKLFILPRLPWYENCSKYGSSSVSSSIDSRESLPGGVSSTGSVENSSGMYFVSESFLISGFQGGTSWNSVKKPLVHKSDDHPITFMKDCKVTPEAIHSPWKWYPTIGLFMDSHMQPRQ